MLHTRARILATLLLLATVVLAGELSQLRIIGSPELVEDGLVSSDIRDANGRICAGIMIVSDMEGFTYQSNNGVVKVSHSPGQDIVYVSPDERKIEVYHSGYEPLKIILSEYSVKLESKRIWSFKITGDKKLDKIPVTIKVQTPDAEILIDNQRPGGGPTYKLSSGSHDIQISKQGYKTYNKSIDISEDKAYFEVTLEEIELQMVTIKSSPNEAMIFIDDVEKGRTNKQLFIYPGRYELRLTKSKYEAVEENIIVAENAENIFNYSLQKSTAVLTIESNISGVEVYINNEKRTGSNWELAPGNYRIELKKEGYFPEARTVTIVKGKDITEVFTLKQKTGSLQVVVEPMETMVVLKRGNRQIDSWTGSKIIKDLQVGEYKLSCSATGFKSQKKTIAVQLQQATNIEVVMVEGPDVPENMVFVEGGTFTMGSNDGESDERPNHRVTLSNFYISKYEVTQREYQEVIGKNPSKFKGNDLPVENVIWYDAVEYCNKKSIKEGLTPCYFIDKIKKDKNNKSTYDKLKYVVTCNFDANGYRLPSEAEWEYAARGGNETRGYKYSGSDNLLDVAWHGENANNVTHPVGGKEPNELGIFDMSGNVWEWSWDWLGKYSSLMVTDPKGPSSDSVRVIRGGSYGSGSCRLANRGNLTPSWSSHKNIIGVIGFRICQSAVE